MRSPFRSRLAPLAAIALAAVLAGCETPAPPAPPPPPPLPPPPAVSLAPSLIEQASAYRGYMARATAIAPTFADGESIARSVKVGAAYEPKQFLRGAVAYAAVVALQDREYVAAVREFAADPAQRREVAARIVANPAYVTTFKGSEGAAGLVTRALRSDSTRLFNAGYSVKIAAYNIQRQSWSKQTVANRDGRLIEARALSAQVPAAETNDIALLQQASVGAASLNIKPGSRPPPYTPLIIRGMAVAALAALGEATEGHMAQLDSVMADQPTGYCLGMAKLNLYQCLAVSKPHYEDVFCLGQHIMMDTGQCLMKGSGAPMPINVAIEPLTLPPPTGKVTYVAPKKGVTKTSTKKN